MIPLALGKFMWETGPEGSVPIDRLFRGALFVGSGALALIHVYFGFYEEAYLRNPRGVITPTTHAGVTGTLMGGIPVRETHLEASQERVRLAR